ncbi:MAG: hypothetical protein ING19_07615 [Azospirillum sp.]|nr:hypothetical protein [Azospirillum sp.]
MWRRGSKRREFSKRVSASIWTIRRSNTSANPWPVEEATSICFSTSGLGKPTIRAPKSWPLSTKNRIGNRQSRRGSSRRKPQGRRCGRKNPPFREARGIMVSVEFGTRLQIAMRQASSVTRQGKPFDHAKPGEFWTFAGFLEMPSAPGEEKEDRRLRLSFAFEKGDGKPKPTESRVRIFVDETPPIYPGYDTSKHDPEEAAAYAHQGGTMNDVILRIGFEFGGFESLIASQGTGVARPLRRDPATNSTIYAIAGLLRKTVDIPNLGQAILLYENGRFVEAFENGLGYPLANGDAFNAAWTKPVWRRQDGTRFALHGTPLPRIFIDRVEEMRSLEKAANLSPDDEKKLWILRADCGDFSLDLDFLERRNKNSEYASYLRKIEKILPGYRERPINDFLNADECAEIETAASRAIEEIDAEKDPHRHPSPASSSMRP